MSFEIHCFQTWFLILIVNFVRTCWPICCFSSSAFFPILSLSDLSTGSQSVVCLLLHNQSNVDPSVSQTRKKGEKGFFRTRKIPIFSIWVAKTAHFDVKLTLVRFNFVWSKFNLFTLHWFRLNLLHFRL